MNEAERYLEKKYKGGNEKPNPAKPVDSIVKNKSSVENIQNNSVGEKSEKGWSVFIIVLSVIATVCFMLFFKACFARI